MKRLFGKPIVYITSMIGILVIIALLNTWTTRSQNLALSEITGIPMTATPTRPPWCKPIPTEPPSLGTASPTPDFLNLVQLPLYTDQPTRTPYPIAHTYDLAPDRPSSEKAIALVFRCNGDMDHYLISPMAHDDLLKAINLGEGDILYT